MKKTINIKPGAVYRTAWDGQLIKIFGSEDYQVFDTILDEGKGWRVECYPHPEKLRITFPRLPVWLLGEKAEFIREEDCNANWIKIARPDLPFNLLRSRSVIWEDLIKNADEKFLKSHFKDLEFELNISRVVLLPLRKNGNYLKPVKVESKGGGNLRYKEILLAAVEAQHEQSKAVYEGVGLHRSGLEKGIPSYYIGGYVDLAGYLKED